MPIGCADDGQAERARPVAVGLGKPRQLAERGEIGQACGAHLAGCP